MGSPVREATEPYSCHRPGVVMQRTIGGWSIVRAEPTSNTG
jgi:hypothetical protein